MSLKHPHDFSSAIKADGKWNPDRVLQLYRGLNPSISRAEAIKAFKSLNLDKSSPYHVPLVEYNSHPIDFSTAVKGNRWDFNRIYALYQEHGIGKKEAHTHFKTLDISTDKPFLNAWSVPSRLLNPVFSGTSYIKIDPWPDMPAETLQRYKQSSLSRVTPWVQYLADQHGALNTFKALLFNTGVAYDLI
jgi:hypothetical protein